MCNIIAYSNISIATISNLLGIVFMTKLYTSNDIFYLSKLFLEQSILVKSSCLGAITKVLFRGERRNSAAASLKINDWLWKFSFCFIKVTKKKYVARLKNSFLGKHIVSGRCNCPVWRTDRIEICKKEQTTVFKYFI